jgi:hypothetical protein
VKAAHIGLLRNSVSPGDDSAMTSNSGKCQASTSFSLVWCVDVYQFLHSIESHFVRGAGWEATLSRERQRRFLVLLCLWYRMHVLCVVLLMCRSGPGTRVAKQFGKIEIFNLYLQQEQLYVLYRPKDATDRPSLPHGSLLPSTLGMLSTTTVVLYRVAS